MNFNYKAKRKKRKREFIFQLHYNSEALSRLSRLNHNYEKISIRVYWCFIRVD
jgi:hypothetical protein